MPHHAKRSGRGRAFTICGLLLLAMTSASAAANWERLAPLPEPNGGFVSGAVADRIVLAGGTNWKDDTKQWLRRIHIYDPAANAWRESSPLAAPLAYAASGEHAGALWFAGGSDGAGAHGMVWKMDGGFAARRAFTPGPGVALAGGAVIGGSLYVLGGTDDMNNLARATNTFHAIDLSSGHTTRLPDYPEPAFITGASAAVGGRFFAFGGARWDVAASTVANLSSAHTFNPSTKQWGKLAALPYAVRGLTACPLDDRRIYLAGGYKNDAEEFTAEAFLYDLRTGGYTPAPPLPHKAMVSLVQLGDWLYCLGGEDRKKHRTDAVFRIKWRELAAGERK